MYFSNENIVLVFKVAETISDCLIRWSEKIISRNFEMELIGDEGEIGEYERVLVLLACTSHEVIQANSTSTFGHSTTLCALWRYLLQNVKHFTNPGVNMRGDPIHMKL